MKEIENKRKRQKKEKKKNKNTFRKNKSYFWFIFIYYTLKFPRICPKMQRILKGIYYLEFIMLYFLRDPPETHSVMKTTSFFLEFTQAVMKLMIFG